MAANSLCQMASQSDATDSSILHAAPLRLEAFLTRMMKIRHKRLAVLAMPRTNFLRFRPGKAGKRESSTMTDANDPSPEQPVVVKKYANRRLYNTESSSYITLENLADMIRKDRDFIVYDAKSGEDITRSVLTQIIVEEEGKGHAMLPTNFLRQLIGFYGDNVQSVVPRYLEQAMSSFARQQEQMRETMQKTIGPFLPPGMEEVGRKNLAMMERAMTLFTPFYAPGGEAARGDEAGHEYLEEIQSLRAEVERLQVQLAQLRAKPKKDV
jgi:polyhydroxyalkanoate synthesis repressor PhaR